MVMFADRPWELRLPVIERGRELHRQIHGAQQPCVMLTELVVCGPNLSACEEVLPVLKAQAPSKVKEAAE
jgi:hypothetical protein